MKKERVKLENSDRYLFVHDESECSGTPCPIHHRTSHAMRKYEQSWRRDLGIFERICEHDVGHPDPDDLGAQEGYASVHSCDGCCGRKVG